jgi:uncharacterized membrane protein YbhN (UPF0104 family)
MSFAGETAPAVAGGQGNNWKKALLTTGQVAITLTVLFFVFRDPTKRAEMAKDLANANHLWLLAGFAFYGIVELIGVYRWHLLLRVQGIYLHWTRLIALLLIGLFFNYFIPGGTGGDVVKIFYLLKETPGQRGPALLSVLVDRIFGVVALCLFAGVLSITHWSWLTSGPESSRYVWATLVLLVSSLGGLHFTYIVTKHGWIHKLPAKFPGRDKLGELALAYNLYGKAWGVCLAALLISIAAHLGYYSVFYCAAESFRGTADRIPSLRELCVIMPVVSTITAMPISLGGIGVREGLFQVFLGELCGVTPGVAVLISSVGYFLTLAWGLVGGLVYLFYRPSGHARLRQIKAEVGDLEHTMAAEEMAQEVAAEEKQR